MAPRIHEFEELPEEEEDVGGTITLADNGYLPAADNVTIRWNAEEHDWIDNTAKQSELDEFKEETNERLAAIEEQVILINRDNILEEDYKELEEAYNAYNDLRDKLRTFKALKDSV